MTFKGQFSCPVMSRRCFFPSVICFSSMSGNCSDLKLLTTWSAHCLVARSWGSPSSCIFQRGESFQLMAPKPPRRALSIIIQRKCSMYHDQYFIQVWLDMYKCQFLFCCCLGVCPMCIPITTSRGMKKQASFSPVSSVTLCCLQVHYTKVSQLYLCRLLGLK